MLAILLTGSVLAGTVLASWKEIVFFLNFERLGANTQGYPEYRHRQTGIVFVRLPGGAFTMGTSEEDQARLLSAYRKSLLELQRLEGFDKQFLEAEYDRRRSYLAAESPQHDVTLSPFLIAKYEVNQAEWKKLMSMNPSSHQGDRLPVEVVSWLDCQRFCDLARLSLPTEAQWEYACRAGTQTLTSFGDTVTSAQATVAEGQVAFQRNPPAVVLRPGFSRRHTVVVDSHVPNAFGIHNMHGNVLEWCEDPYDPAFYTTAAARQKDPLAHSDSGRRVVRGGAYFGGQSRSGARDSGSPERRGRSDRGFRPVFSFR